MVSTRYSTSRLLTTMFLSWILLLLLIFPDYASASNVEDSLVIGIQSTKTNVIHPFDPKERDMLSIYDMVYESLITLDDNYVPQGQLAESWEQTGNGKTWTFHLRPGITFSDGTPLTAYDVVASAQAILDRANDESTTDTGYYVNLKYFISSINAPNETTVVVKAKRKYYGLLYEMTFPVVPATQVNADQPIGSGPYTIEAFIAGDYIWLQANRNWWQSQPQVRDIMVYLRSTPQEVIESYEYANVNAIFTRSIAAAQYRTGTNSLSISYRTNQLQILAMNNSAREMTKEVRQAIRYAIDPEKIISTVYSDMAIATDTPMLPGTWMYDDSLSSYFSFNPTQAKRLLSEAGWEDTDDDGIRDRINNEGKQINLHLRFYVYEEPDNNVRVAAANMIVDMLTDIGISCSVETMTMNAMKQKLSAGSFDLALMAYAMDVCPDPGFMLMRGNTGNYFRYKSERITTLCNELRTALTQEEYRNKLFAIQKVFAEDCPFMCLYYRTGTVLTRYMYTTVREVREYELLRGIESFKP